MSVRSIHMSNVQFHTVAFEFLKWAANMNRMMLGNVKSLYANFVSLITSKAQHSGFQQNAF